MNKLKYLVFCFTMMSLSKPFVKANPGQTSVSECQEEGILIARAMNSTLLTARQLAQRYLRSKNGVFEQLNQILPPISGTPDKTEGSVTTVKGRNQLSVAEINLRKYEESKRALMSQLMASLQNNQNDVVFATGNVTLAIDDDTPRSKRDLQDMFKSMDSTESQRLTLYEDMYQKITGELDRNSEVLNTMIQNGHDEVQQKLNEIFHIMASSKCLSGTTNACQDDLLKELDKLGKLIPSTANLLEELERYREQMTSYYESDPLKQTLQSTLQSIQDAIQLQESFIRNQAAGRSFDNNDSTGTWLMEPVLQTTGTTNVELTMELQHNLEQLTSLINKQYANLTKQMGETDLSSTVEDMSDIVEQVEKQVEAGKTCRNAYVNLQDDLTATIDQLENTYGSNNPESTRDVEMALHSMGMEITEGHEDIRNKIKEMESTLIESLSSGFDSQIKEFSTKVQSSFISNMNEIDNSLSSVQNKIISNMDDISTKLSDITAEMEEVLASSQNNLEDLGSLLESFDEASLETYVEAQINSSSSDMNIQKGYEEILEIISELPERLKSSPDYLKAQESLKKLEASVNETAESLQIDLSTTTEDEVQKVLDILTETWDVEEFSHAIVNKIIESFAGEHVVVDCSGGDCDNQG